MKQICVYRGLGAHKEATRVLLRMLDAFVDSKAYTTRYITPDEIRSGQLLPDVALLAIGGGYDLGLIEALGQTGMVNIRDYVFNGGSYLGICSGAYFGCDRIEFDKGGPQEVVGERYLKFFPGLGKGPLFKPYDYNSKAGATASKIDFKPSSRILKFTQSTLATLTSSGLHDNASNHSRQIISQNQTLSQCAAFFNGGCSFHIDGDTDMTKVTVLSRYLDLPESPPAIVKCQCGKGVAILMGPHLEYDVCDIEEDPLVKDIVPELRSSEQRKYTVLQDIIEALSISTLPRMAKL